MIYNTPMLEKVIRGTPKEQKAKQTISELESKEVRTKREEKLYQQALKDRRNLRNRRVSWGIVTACALGLTILTLTQLSPKENSWLKIQDIDQIGAVRANIARQAALDWDRRYHCQRDVTIKFRSYVEEKSLPDGQIVIVEESASPGLIAIGPEVDIRDNVLHAMTHACQPDNFTPVTPFRIRGAVVVGYHGASVKVTPDSTGEENYFRKVEEGIAERNASWFQGYEVGHRALFEVGSEALSDFPLQAGDLVEEWVKSNDMPQIVREILRLPPGSPVGPEELESAMTKYQQAWDRGQK